MGTTAAAVRFRNRPPVTAGGPPPGAQRQTAPAESKNKPPLRVLVADDHPAIRRALAALVNQHSDMQVVGEACDGGDALRQAAQLRPDVVVMDLSMPQMDGIQATRHLRQTLPDTWVILVTMCDGWDTAQRARAAGARGFLRKDQAGEHLVRLIRRRAQQSFEILQQVCRSQLREGGG